MSDGNEEVLRQLKELQARMAGPTPPGPMMPMAPAPGPMMQQGPAMQPGPSAGAWPQVLGVLVPVSIPTQEGEVTVQVQLGPEAAANPQQAVMQLLQAGWPVRVYRPRPSGGFNGYGGGGFRGGAGGWGGSGGAGRGWGR